MLFWGNVWFFNAQTAPVRVLKHCTQVCFDWLIMYREKQKFIFWYQKLDFSKNLVFWRALKHFVSCSHAVKSHPRKLGVILLRNDRFVPTNVIWYETKFWILGYFGCLADMNEFFSFSVHDQSIKINLGAMFHNWNWSSLRIKVPNIPQKQQKLLFFWKIFANYIFIVTEMMD